MASQALPTRVRTASRKSSTPSRRQPTNNGSRFAGLSANTPFYNGMLGIAMWFGRFGVIVPVLALAGGLAAKKRIAASAGTMPTHGPLFIVLLIGHRRGWSAP